ncbi:hypothetical protein P3G55_13710 [Leptospira sp. 96542]|nr:hypothetical protein [Leptospira sp. 96542]
MKQFTYFIFLSFFSVGLFAEPNAGFAHPLQIEPVAVYTKIRGNITYWDKDFNQVYEQNKNLNVEGEFKFFDHFSIISSLGRNEYSYTDSGKEATWDRWNAGIKYGKIFDWGSSQFLIGAGLRLYDKKRNAVFRERENPDYYLVRPNFGLGFKYGIFEIMSEFRFQTETNRHGRETNLQEFKRYYQVGLAPSVGLTKSFRIFTELEYREPFDKEVDKSMRYFNLYPGATYKTESFGTFGLSLLFGMLPKDENAMDRGIRFSYFYFFDPE